MKLTKKDIVFVMNPSQLYGHIYASGILCLAAYLELKGYDSIILDSAVSRSVISDQAAREEKIISKIY